MERQVQFLNSLFLSPNQNQIAPQMPSSQDFSSFPSQIMSCPDLDALDNLFSQMNTNKTLYPPMNPTLNTNTALEGQSDYLVNFDIYGREILESPRGTLDNAADGRGSLDGSNMNLEEEERDVVEFSIDKENLLPPQEEFVPRRRAQSDHFSTLSTSSRPRTFRRAPLMDITPAPAKKLVTGSPGHKITHLQYAKSPIMETFTGGRGVHLSSAAGMR